MSESILRRNAYVKVDQNNNDCYVVHECIVGRIDCLSKLFREKHLHAVKQFAKRSSVTSGSQILLNDTFCNRKETD